MSFELPKIEMGQPLLASHENPDFAQALWKRRSTLADQLGEPGPSTEILEQILTIAARVPDHGRVVPFRFIRIAGSAREALGARLAEIYGRNNPDASEAHIAREARRFLRAPVTICVVASLNPEHRIPIWEQTMTCGAVCQNLLLAASVHGFAAQWLTEWYAYDAEILKELGLREHEQVAGYLYIGTAQADPKERARPDIAAITSDLAIS